MADLPGPDITLVGPKKDVGIVANGAQGHVELLPQLAQGPDLPGPVVEALKVPQLGPERQEPYEIGREIQLDGRVAETRHIAGEEEDALRLPQAAVTGEGITEEELECYGIAGFQD